MDENMEQSMSASTLAGGNQASADNTVNLSRGKISFKPVGQNKIRSGKIEEKYMIKTRGQRLFHGSLLLKGQGHKRNKSAISRYGLRGAMMVN